MEVAVFLMKNTAVLLLSILYFALFLRMILSWLDPEMEKRFSVFLFMITEPMIKPVRALFYRMNWFQNTPFDVSFMVTSLIVLVALTLLGA